MAFFRSETLFILQNKEFKCNLLPIYIAVTTSGCTTGTRRLMQNKESERSPNAIWLQHVGCLEYTRNIPICFSRLEKKLPFTQWFNHVVTNGLLHKDAAMDKLVKCATLWNTTVWKMHDTEFEVHFLKTQRLLHKHGMLPTRIRTERSPLFYTSAQLKTFEPYDFEEAEEEKGCILFLDLISPQKYSTRYAKYIFDKDRAHVGHWERPTEIARGRRVYFLPLAQMNFVLAQCCFGKTDWKARKEHLPLQIDWIASILGISTSCLLQYPLVLKSELRFVPFVPLDSPRFARFYDGMNLDRELRTLYATFLSKFENAPLNALTALSRRDLFVRYLKSSTVTQIQNKIQYSELCSPCVPEHMYDSISDRHKSPPARVFSGLPSTKRSLALSTTNALENLRMDRCFPGDRIIGGNFQSRLFSIFIWTTILVSDMLMETKRITATDAFKLCISSMTLSIQTPCTAITRANGRSTHSVFHLSFLMTNYFGGNKDSVETLKHAFSETVLCGVAVSHFNAIAVSQNLQWPPYQDYHHLMRSIVPSNNTFLKNTKAETGWRVVHSCTHHLALISDIEYEIHNAFGVFLSQGFSSTMRGYALSTRQYYDQGPTDDQESFSAFHFDSCGYAETIPTLDAVYHLLKNVLFYNRMYEWWKPGPRDDFSEEEEEEEEEDDNTFCSDSTHSIVPMFECPSVVLDTEVMAIIPKAEFSVVPVMVKDNLSAWIFHWAVSKEILGSEPIFVHPSEETMPFESSVDAFVEYFTFRFTDVVRLGTYMLYILNEAIQCSDRSACNHLVLPTYPIVAPLLERTYATHVWSKSVGKKTFGDSSNLIYQTVQSLVHSEVLLSTRCLSIKALMHDEEPALEHERRQNLSENAKTFSSNMLFKPALHAEAVHGLFFTLAIPALWTFLLKEYIHQDQMDQAIRKLRLFFRLFSSCKEHDTIYLPEDEDRLESMHFTCAIKVRSGTRRKGLMDTCPVFLDIIGEDRMDLSSCEYSTVKKKTEPPYTEDTVPYQDRLLGYDDPCVEIREESPAKWFFFSHVDWTQFLSHCIQAVWNSEEDEFEFLVQELFTHAYTKREFEAQKRNTRKRKRGDPAPLEPHMQRPLCGAYVQPEVPLVLKHSGYALVSPEEDLSWNPFGMISLLLEYGHVPGLDQLFSTHHKHEMDLCPVPLLRDYLTRAPENHTPSMLYADVLLDYAPVEVCVEEEECAGMSKHTTSQKTPNVYVVRWYHDCVFLPEKLPGLGWQHFSDRNISSFVADTFYLFGRTNTGFL